MKAGRRGAVNVATALTTSMALTIPMAGGILADGGS
jgi:hypothetical protein